MPVVRHRLAVVQAKSVWRMPQPRIRVIAGASADEGSRHERCMRRQSWLSFDHLIRGDDVVIRSLCVSRVDRQSCELQMWLFVRERKDRSSRLQCQ